MRYNEMLCVLGTIAEKYGSRTRLRSDSRNPQPDILRLHDCLPHRKTSREYVMHARHACMFDR